MNLSFETHHLVAHWVPGFVLLLLVPVLAPESYGRISKLFPTEQASRALIWAILPFVSGQLIDCLRNSVFEGLLDKLWKKVNWNFFFTGEKENLEKLRRYFFDYYVFDVNLIVPSVFFSLWRLVEWTWGPWHWGQCAVGLAITYLLFRDARSLRYEIAEHTKSTH